jgi:hypothetical protein
MWMTRKKRIKTSVSVGIFKPRFQLCSIKVNKLLSCFNDAASAAVFRRFMMIKNGYVRRNTQALRKGVIYLVGQSEPRSWFSNTSHTFGQSVRLNYILTYAELIPYQNVLLRLLSHRPERKTTHDPFCFDCTETLFYLTTRITHHSLLGPPCGEREGGYPWIRWLILIFQFNNTYINVQMYRVP